MTKRRMASPIGTRATSADDAPTGGGNSGRGSGIDHLDADGKRRTARDAWGPDHPAD
jgi:hypothetical protein